MRQRVQHLQAFDIDKQVLLGKREVLLQVPIALQRVLRIRNQRLFLGKPHWPDLVGIEPQRQGLVIAGADRQAIVIHELQADSRQMTQ